MSSKRGVVSLNTTNYCGRVGYYHSDTLNQWGTDVIASEQNELDIQTVKDNNVQQSVAVSDFPHRPSK